MQIPYRKPGKYMSMKPDFLITQDKFDELTARLDKLKRVTRPVAAAEVSRLAELGDFSENAEYQLAKGRLRSINNTILLIESQLTHAVIIPPSTASDMVAIGSRVVVRSGDKEYTYQILGSSETKPGAGVISHLSPLGAALLNKRVGETAVIKTSGREKHYLVVRIGK